MLQHGFVVALNASAETIIQRVSADTNRPLLQGNLEERVHTLMEQRKHAYDFAHISIDTTELTEDEIADRIIHKLGFTRTRRQAFQLSLPTPACRRSCF